MELGKDGIIVHKNSRKIVVRWWNYCPVLEVCRKLGLDTRIVCKLAYHKPVELFLKRINPKLGFNRNYEKIRPYAPYCEEIIFIEDI